MRARCPVFLLDLDQGLELKQVMGVAHAFESEVGCVIVMDDNAIGLLVDMSASGGDAQDGQ